MKEFAAELERAFGAAPGGETGLVIDTFDGAGLDGGSGIGTCYCRPSVSPCRTCATRVTGQA
jgi:hypothetical protein